MDKGQAILEAVEASLNLEGMCDSAKFEARLASCGFKVVAIDRKFHTNEDGEHPRDLTDRDGIAR